VTAADTYPSFLPADGGPQRLIDPDGRADPDACRLRRPDGPTLARLHAAMVIGRRFDAQATALTKQGRLAVYPSSRGQEACQVGAVLALAEADWLFPTYRDSVAVLTRGVDAVGLAHAARLKGEDIAALVLLGDGATSEGDTHEALNFAAVWRAPVVFLVQNNGYAISVPLAKQTAAPSLAYKGVGYGTRSLLVDGNDAAAVYAAVRDALDRGRAGEGPTLIEALTYRVEAHTNADDAGRYRDADEVDRWLARDPIARLEAYLRAAGALDDAAAERLAVEAERLAADVRARLGAEPAAEPDALFAHVYAEPTRALRAQREQLRAERDQSGDHVFASDGRAGAAEPTMANENAISAGRQS
jgi:pyruvate dehydrogenase E1 component alpha subunit